MTENRRQRPDRYVTRHVRSEEHDLEEHRRLRMERRRRERARIRRQRLALTIATTLALALVACGVGAWAAMPAPTAPRRMAEAVGDEDGPGAGSAAAARLVKYAPRALKPKPPPGPKPMKPAPGERVVVVDKGAQKVVLYDSKGRVVANWDCASGVYYPKTGEYRVTSHKESSYYPADGSRFTYFTIFTRSEKGTNIGFHSIPHTPEGEDVPGGLGKPISHGCVRLADANARLLFSWAAVGTKVVVRP